MTPCTEIATLPIVAGAAIEEEGTSTYTIWQDLLNTIASQDGYQRLYWGRRIEDQSAVSLLIGKHYYHSKSGSTVAVPWNPSKQSGLRLYRLEFHRRPQSLYILPPIYPILH